MKCSVKGCPAATSDAWHVCWARDIPGHECFGGLSHQHWPKKGMGGNNPKAKIVACLCIGAHDRIDNGDWGNEVIVTTAMTEDSVRLWALYRAWDIHNNTLIERVIDPPWWEQLLDGDGGQAVNLRVSDDQEANPPPPSADLPTPPPNRLDEAVFGPPYPKEEDDGREREDRVSLAIRGGLPGADRERPRLESQARTEGYLDSLETDTWHPVSLRLPAEFTFADAERIARTIGDAKKGNPWWAGDFTIDVEAKWPHESSQFLELLGYQPESLGNCVRVCRHYAVADRNPGVTFNHHAVLISLPLPDARERLQEAADGGWSVKALKEAVFGPPKPRARRWTLAELRELMTRFEDAPKRLLDASGARTFLDWLEGEG